MAAPGKAQDSPFKRGIFTISLDFELIWGTVDLFGPQRFAQACRVERELIDRLLELFVEFDVPATWCIVGHLFLDRCEAAGGRKHPEIVPPQHGWCTGDWFEHDPCTTEDEAPLFYGRSLVEKIRACAVFQEIGCHTFSHAILGDPGCSPAAANSELAACVEAATSLGIELRSFAFPRNRPGHFDVLREHGIRCFRGPEPRWYERVRGLRRLERLFHLGEVLLAWRPPVVVPEVHESGLWNLPGSMMYFPMHGLRRYIPLKLRVKRAIKGLDAAARQRRVFHLWFHPTNLADQPEKMFLGLRQILEHARRLRCMGVLEVLPMAEVCRKRSPDAVAASCPAVP